MSVNDKPSIDEQDDAEYQEAYEQAIAEGMTEADAANYASYAVGGEDVVFEEPADDEEPEIVYEDDGQSVDED